MTELIGPNEAIEFLKRYSADLGEACPVVNCQAQRGQPCRDVPAGKVHQSRRIARLQRESRPTHPSELIKLK
jgi:hypothetical protein